MARRCSSSAPAPVSSGEGLGKGARRTRRSCRASAIRARGEYGLSKACVVEMRGGHGLSRARRRQDEGP
eukprot:15447310-Alexandrium_andersonii.AAC.1